MHHALPLWQLQNNQTAKDPLSVCDPPWKTEKEGGGVRLHPMREMKRLKPFQASLHSAAQITRLPSVAHDFFHCVLPQHSEGLSTTVLPRCCSSAESTGWLAVVEPTNLPHTHAH